MKEQFIITRLFFENRKGMIQENYSIAIESVLELIFFNSYEDAKLYRE